VLGVGLPDGDGEPEFLADLLAPRGQLGVAGQAVHVDLAGTEPAQVRTVEDVHVHAATSAYAASSRASEGASRMPGRARPDRTTKRRVAPRDFLSTRMVARSASHSVAG